MAECVDSSTDNDAVSGQKKSALCQPCLKKDKETKADKFCSTCDEFQCMDCLNVHYTYAFMNGHNIVNTNEVEKKRASFDMKGLDQCGQHQKLLEFFCEDEKQLCCSTCAIVDHRKCNSVVDVRKVVGKSTLKSSRVILQEIKQKVKIIINNIAYSKEKLDEDVKDIPVKIRQMRDEVIKMFDELEISVVKNAESFQKETLARLSEKQSQIERYLADQQSFLETIEGVYQNGTSVQQFIVEQKMQRGVDDLRTNVDAECKDLETMTVTFDFDETLQLPPLPIIDHVPGQLSLKSQLTEAARTIVPVIAPMKLLAMKPVDLKQRKDDKKEPLITGMDFLPDGRLVAVDNYNMKCLVYNKKLDKVGSYQLSYIPQSIVAVSEEEVAITSSAAYKFDILCVDKSNNITPVRNYKVTTSYDTICIKDSGHFLVGTCNHPSPARILSYTGEEKDFNSNIPNKRYALEKSACTYVRTSDKIVITDRNEHVVYIYDIKTNTRVVVKDDHVKEPRGVAVGPSDTILVCSQNPDSIVQISQTGRILSSHKTDMKLPRTICVSHDKSYIVVANASNIDRKLQKLKISY